MLLHWFDNDHCQPIEVQNLPSSKFRVLEVILIRDIQMIVVHRFNADNFCNLQRITIHWIEPGSWGYWTLPIRHTPRWSSTVSSSFLPQPNNRSLDQLRCDTPRRAPRIGKLLLHLPLETPQHLDNGHHTAKFQTSLANEKKKQQQKSKVQPTNHPRKNGNPRNARLWPILARTAARLRLFWTERELGNGHGGWTPRRAVGARSSVRAFLGRRSVDEKTGSFSGSGKERRAWVPKSKRVKVSARGNSLRWERESGPRTVEEGENEP